MSGVVVLPQLRGRFTIALAFAVGAVATVAPTPTAARGHVWAFVLAAIVGELIVLDDVRGASAPTSVAVIAAFALLGHGPVAAALVAAVGWAVAAGVRTWRGEHPHPAALGERVLAAWVLGGAAALGALVRPDVTIGTDGAGIPVAAILAVAGGLLVGPAVWDLRSSSAEVGGGTRIRRSAGVGIALGASAALVAVAHGLLGAGALLLLLPPVLAVRAGLRRYVDIRRTYDQTVVAMSRMTELTGHAEPGHGVRVADLAVQLGRVLDLGDRELRSLERAGHLHELGRIVTDDPERAAKDREVAVAGAAIVREAGGMDGVADVIERHRDPYRRVGRPPDRSLPLASRIVHTACEYDRLVRGGAVDRWGALDVLQGGGAHDPEVVSALVRVVAV